jgi:hypothetical protein
MWRCGGKTAKRPKNAVQSGKNHILPYSIADFSPKSKSLFSRKKSGGVSRLI